jgi:hypothetical protein
MFNILSGLQEGSHSVMITSRSGPAGLVKGTLVQLTSTSNTIAKADNSSIGIGSSAGFIFEDLLTQTSGTYTVIYGTMEAETDQVSGTPAIGSYLKPGTSTTAGLLIAATLPTDANLVNAQVVDSYSIANDAQGISTSVYRIVTF